jgi:hypothetical protein
MYLIESPNKIRVKRLWGDFNAKVGREDIFKPTIENDSLHEISNDTGVVNFATSKNLIVKSEIFSYRSIHKFTWISSDGKAHSQIDHTMLGRRWQSSVRVLGVQSFRGADCETDLYLVVTKIRERLAVSKQNCTDFLGRSLIPTN